MQFGADFLELGARIEYNIAGGVVDRKGSAAKAIDRIEAFFVRIPAGSRGDLQVAGDFLAGKLVEVGVAKRALTYLSCLNEAFSSASSE